MHFDMKNTLKNNCNYIFKQAFTIPSKDLF